MAFDDGARILTTSEDTAKLWNAVSFGLARLPKNSVFCRHASGMVLAQHSPELALAAIDKALLADPTGF